MKPIPCQICGKEWVQESGTKEYGTFKADCECLDNKRLRMMVG